MAHGAEPAALELTRAHGIERARITMPARKSATKEHEHLHADGSLWGRGAMKGKKMHGYWEWFRKDGTRLRSGWFDDGVQVGEWTTYDRQGEVYKVTRMKPKPR